MTRHETTFVPLEGCDGCHHTGCRYSRRASSHAVQSKEPYGCNDLGLFKEFLKDLQEKAG